MILRKKFVLNLAVYRREFSEKRGKKNTKLRVICKKRQTYAQKRRKIGNYTRNIRRFCFTKENTKLFSAKKQAQTAKNPVILSKNQSISMLTKNFRIKFSVISLESCVFSDTTISLRKAL